jgi:hypothetical protein
MCLKFINKLLLTEGLEKPHYQQIKAIMNGWNYDASCKLTLLPVSDLSQF